MRELVKSTLTGTRQVVRGALWPPVVGLTLLLTMAIGVGAAASVFTVLDPLLLRPLPYYQPDRLVSLNMGTRDSYRPFLFPQELEAVRSSELLPELGLYTQWAATRTGGGDPELVRGIAASSTLSGVLGIQAHLGRLFVEEDGAPGVRRALVTYDYWQRTGASPDVIGSMVRLDDVAHEVVGVLPDQFKFPVWASGSDVWVPLPDAQPTRTIMAVARLPDATTREAIEGRLASQWATLSAGAGTGPAAEAPVLESVNAWRGNPDLVRGMWFIAAAAVLILLVAVANALNVLLFRALDRVRDLKVRIALGASRGRLLRQAVAENVLLGLLYGVLAAGVTLASVWLLNRGLPEELAFASAYAFRVTDRVLGFTFLLALTLGAVIGILATWYALRPGVSRLDLGQRGDTRRHGMLPQLFVVAEVALAVGLLMGAGLLTSSFGRLMRVDPGFGTENLAFLWLSLPSARYSDAQAISAFYLAIEASLEALPEVTAVTATDGVPPYTGWSSGPLEPEGGPVLARSQRPGFVIPNLQASPDFLEVMDGRLLAGRGLTEADVGTEHVLIDDAMAAALWAGTSPLGRRLRVSDEERWVTVVGVFEHMTMNGPDDRNAPYGMIFPRDATRAGRDMMFAVRTRGESSRALVSISGAVHQLDPDLPIFRIETAVEALSQTIHMPRFLARVMAALSTAALLLAAVGVYAVLSYAVRRRWRELGIRVAVGASPARVRRIVLSDGITLALAGVVLGSVVGLALGRLVQPLLFRIAPSDPWTLSAVTATMLGAALAASMIPAQRALRIDPARLLTAD